MSKVRILRKDGTPTPYFWSDRENTDRTRRTVFKEADGRVKRMTGVHFNSVTKRFQKD